MLKPPSTTSPSFSDPRRSLFSRSRLTACTPITLISSVSTSPSPRMRYGRRSRLCPPASTRARWVHLRIPSKLLGYCQRGHLRYLWPPLASSTLSTRGPSRSLMRHTSPYSQSVLMLTPSSTSTPSASSTSCWLVIPRSWRLCMPLRLYLILARGRQNLSLLVQPLDPWPLHGGAGVAHRRLGPQVTMQAEDSLRGAAPAVLGG